MTKNDYNYTEILECFKNIGLKKGDTAFFSTSLGIPSTINDAQSLNRFFFEAMAEALGDDGTFVVPTYSYTFGESTKTNPKVFDSMHTPSKIGPFPNFFLNQRGVMRSLDPMMSIAGLGPSSPILLNDLPHTSFGHDCVFARLLRHPNTKCVNIGLGPNWIPFLHHAEWLAKVPFRYDKIFYGGVKRTKRIDYINWLYSVRAPIGESRADAHKLAKLSVKAGIWKWTSLGRARVFCCDYGDLFDFTMAAIKKDKWLTAVGPPCQVVVEQKKDLQRPLDYPWHHETMPELLKSPREVMDDRIYAVLSSLERVFPITLNKFETGLNLYDWVVPEKESKEHQSLFPAQMYIGDWCLNGESKKTILLCCYLDSNTDQTLVGLDVTLGLMQNLNESDNVQNLTYRLAILPGTVGYAGYLNGLVSNKILGAIHIIGNDTHTKPPINLPQTKVNSLQHEISYIIRKYNFTLLNVNNTFDPLCSGDNPVAVKNLKDIEFDNVVIDIPAKKRNSDYKTRNLLVQLIDELENLVTNITFQTINKI